MKDIEFCHTNKYRRNIHLPQWLATVDWDEVRDWGQKKSKDFTTKVNIDPNQVTITRLDHSKPVRNELTRNNIIWEE